MLNTVMALWNQHPGENRQRVVKLFFTMLFVGVSIFLLLFTLNSSAWFSVTGKEQIQTQKEGSVGMSNHSGMATVGNTPASYGVVAGITPAARRTSQVCVSTPTVVVQPSATPQPVVVYARNSGSDHERSKSHQVHPMAVHVRKGKQHPSKRPHVKPIATSVPQEIVIVMPPPSPVPATPQLMVTPVVTASVTETPVPAEGTVVSSMPDIVIINATPDTSMTSTNSFVDSLQKRETMRIHVQPIPKSTKRNVVKKSDRVREEVECSRRTAYKDDSEEPIVKAKRHVGLLLGSSLLGTLLFCCFVFVRRREK